MTLSSGNPRGVGNIHIYVICQTDVVNKQLVSALSWNNHLSETSFGESYILHHLQRSKGQGKYSLDVEGVNNM